MPRKEKTLHRARGASTHAKGCRTRWADTRGAGSVGACSTGAWVQRWGSTRPASSHGGGAHTPPWKPRWVLAPRSAARQGPPPHSRCCTASRVAKGCLPGSKPSSGASHLGLTLGGLTAAVEGVARVADELGVNTLGGTHTVHLGALDACRQVGGVGRGRRRGGGGAAGQGEAGVAAGSKPARTRPAHREHGCKHRVAVDSAPASGAAHGRVPIHTLPNMQAAPSAAAAPWQGIEGARGWRLRVPHGRCRPVGSPSPSRPPHTVLVVALAARGLRVVFLLRHRSCAGARERQGEQGARGRRNKRAGRCDGMAHVGRWSKGKAPSPSALCCTPNPAPTPRARPLPLGAPHPRHYHLLWRTKQQQRRAQQHDQARAGGTQQASASNHTQAPPSKSQR
jgi:hypothetical protein